MKRQLLKGFYRPKGIALEHDTANERYAKFSAYPFERGYGTTIGNSLRRILLSSIQGYAITALYISYQDGDTKQFLPSEFQSIPHVLEDTIEVISNLKKVRLMLTDRTPVRMVTTTIDKEGDFTAALLFDATNIKLLNPNQHILTASQGVNVDIEFQIEQGIGYRSIEQGQEMIETKGALPIDAIFSPVERVRFDIEDYRISNRSNYEKLILEIWTDGSVGPVDAVAEAAKIAKEHYTVFINFDESEIEILEGEIGDDTRIRKILGSSVESLDLSARAGNCLKNAGISTIGELIKRSENELADMRNFGKKSFDEIKAKLKEMWDLRLGMGDIDEIRTALRISPQSRRSEESET